MPAQSTKMLVYTGNIVPDTVQSYEHAFPSWKRATIYKKYEQKFQILELGTQISSWSH